MLGGGAFDCAAAGIGVFGSACAFGCAAAGAGALGAASAFGCAAFGGGDSVLRMEEILMAG